MDDADFQRLYGPWQPLTPLEVRDLFADAPFRWWIAAGWAVELASGSSRDHGDTDVVVLFDDLPAIRDHLCEFHLWEAHSGALQPLLPGEDMRPGREQLWVRRDATQPWLVDLLFSKSENGRWIFKRDDRISLPLDEIGATRDDGIHYLRPPVALLHKAKGLRDKDAADFETLLPLLDAEDRRWLDKALALAHPGHPWRARLG